MARTLTRPMFRKGGMARREEYMGGGIKTVRPKYMGGGMTGIMSGIVPDAGLTPRVGYQEGTTMFNKFLTDTPFGRELQKIATATNRNIADVVTAVYDMGGVPANKITEFFTGANPGFSGTRFTQQIPIIGESIAERDPDKAYFFGATTDAAPKAGIFASEEPVVTTAKGPPGGGDKKMFSDPLNTIGGEKDIKDEETALMKAYKEYAPIFEKELGVSSDDTKKALYLQLAKAGLGVAGAPGGDLLGTIAREGQKGIEGAEGVIKEKRDSKRQAKLLALQTAIKENEGGPLDKTLKAIAKAKGYKGKDKLKQAYDDYVDLQTNDRTFQAAETKRYADSASSLGLKFSNQEKYISESKKLPSLYPELIGRFNEILPDELDEDNVGAYYVSETGRFVRVIEKDGEITAIGMNEEGFKDKPKEK